ncbi:MAG: FlgD immunoglobulin-like domain containing protein, partial [Ignavibacteria bacterium]|nr:FlgD immunoglobulin-like domain containing protein [Ignavibacteria bacterium]
KVDLKYPTWFAVSDTASLSILLDNQRIPFDQLNIKNDSANRTLTFEFIPALSSGEHQFKIFGNNVYGKLDNQPGFERVFVVSDQFAIMNCYNYPNPVKDNTYFTFKLPQLPEELTIRVYTIAGRLVKEIKKSSAELSVDFNRIFWDTKDQDGDQLANGVYLYKVIAKKNGKSESITQKLAIVK